MTKPQADDTIGDYRVLLDTSPDVMFAMDENLVITYINESVETLLGIRREEVIGEEASVFLEADVVERDDYVSAVVACQLVMADPERERDKFELTLETVDGDTIQAEYHIAAIPAAHPGTTDGVVGIIRDISRLKYRESRIQAQRDELAMLNTVYSQIHEVIRLILPASDRAHIERQVCTGLSATSAFDEALVADRHPAGSVQVRAAAPDETSLDDVGEECGSLAGLADTIASVLRTGESQWVDGCSEPGGQPDGSARSATYVCPIPVASSSPAALVVQTARNEVFAEGVREAFDVLSEVVGLAIDAVQTEELLRGDSVVELTVGMPATETWLGDIADRCDGEVNLESYVPLPGSQGGAFVTVTTDDPDATVVDDIAGLETTSPRVKAVSLVAEGETRFRFHVIFQAPLNDLLDSGIRIKEAVVRAERQTITLELAPAVEPAAVVDRIQFQRPGAEVRSIRKIERTPQSLAEFYSAVHERLTPKQRNALQSAYLAGYYEWPSRGSTAEEVADLVGISSATLHGHLRKAHQQIMHVLFDAEIGSV